MPTQSTSTQTPQYDLIVIGSGPAGQRAALQGAKAGKRVAIIEDHPALGGGCVHSGTLPSKSFRESVYRYSMSSRGFLGQESEDSSRSKRAVKKDLPEMSRLLKRRDRVVSGEAQVIYDQLKRNNIDIYSGHGKFLSATEVEVQGARGSKKLSGKFVFIATGARPVAPSHLAIDGKTVLDSNSILCLKRVPKSIVVLGGGIIGCEYASMFSMAGSRVFMVDRRNEILASVDREIVNILMERFDHQGTEIILGCEATKIERKPGKGRGASGGAKVHLSNGRKIQCDVVLVAQGRFGNTDNLGLEAIGVQRDERGLIKVDKNFRTTVPNVFAVGDVVGAPALASTSMEQGRIACCQAFGISVGKELAKESTEFVMPSLFPYGIYTIPEISIIGLTEEDAKAKGLEFVVGRARYRELARGQIVGDRWGMLKMIVEKKTLKIHGVHIIGDSAADLIHIGQAVMSFGGDVTYFIHSVFNYPTLAEAYKTAAFHAVNQLRGTTKTR